MLSDFPPSFRSAEAPLRMTPSHYRSASVTRGPRRPGRPRVYVTLGTIFNKTSGDLFERLLAGLADLDADVVVTVGRDLDPAAFGATPGHVRVERFVPQDEVLATTDLVVSHGGSGSLMAALAHGLPSVLLPLGADQPHNALRARELGVATTLDAATAAAGRHHPGRGVRPRQTPPWPSGAGRWPPRSARCRPSSPRWQLLERAGTA